MPRPKNYILHDLFQINDSNEVICNNGKCNNRVLNKHSGNLERHLKQLHPDVYAYYVEHRMEKKLLAPVRAKVVTNFIPSNIEMAIVELFTKNDWSLDMANDRAFRILAQPCFDFLGINVNKRDINERIMAFSRNLKREIIKEVKGKLLSLKIDVATTQYYSLLGIGVQYISKKCIQMKTLAVKELKSSHTGEDLKSLVLEVLNEYGIDIKQIFTIVTDNGANMTKAEATVEDLNENFPITVKEEIVDDTLDNKVVVSGFKEDKMESIRSAFYSYNINNVSCGAQTLQLCVLDVIKQPEINIKLEKCRSVVNNLRAPNYLSILLNGHYKTPITDCSTRWNSTFRMLVWLVEVKDVLDTLSPEDNGLYLSPEEWQFVEEFIKIFQPIHTATIKLQTEQLCFSELYIIIMDISFQVEALPSNEMTILLIDSLNKRKAKLFNGELFNAAVFLDPRIKICMNAEQKERAKNYINYLFRRMRSSKETAYETENKFIKPEPFDQPSTSKHNLSRSFSEYLEKLDPVSSENTTSLLSELEHEFITYDRQSRLSLETDIIDYWSTQSNNLSEIAHIILAIPTSQVSVERLIAALSYISPNHPERLSISNLEHIFMIKLNGVFNYAR